MAIQSLTDLKALINSTIQDNTTNDISGSDVQTALINAIDTLDSLEGFINVHKANGQTTITAYGSKALARAAVPDDCKKEGVVIAYKISTGWLIEQNLDATAGTWGDDASWQTIGPVSVSQNSQTGHTEIHIGSNDYPVPSVNESDDKFSTLDKYGLLGLLDKGNKQATLIPIEKILEIQSEDITADCSIISDSYINDSGEIVASSLGWYCKVYEFSDDKIIYYINNNQYCRIIKTNDTPQIGSVGEIYQLTGVDTQAEGYILVHNGDFIVTCYFNPGLGNTLIYSLSATKFNGLLFGEQSDDNFVEKSLFNKKITEQTESLVLANAFIGSDGQISANTNNWSVRIFKVTHKSTYLYEALSNYCTICIFDSMPQIGSTGSLICYTATQGTTGQFVVNEGKYIGVGYNTSPGLGQVSLKRVLIDKPNININTITCSRYGTSGVDADFCGLNAIGDAVASINDASEDNIYNIVIRGHFLFTNPKLIADGGDFKYIEGGEPTILIGKDFVNFVGIDKEQAIIEINFDDSLQTTDFPIIDGVRKSFSDYQPVYIRHQSTIKNLSMIGTNCRYVVHIGDGLGKKNIKIGFENCRLQRNVGTKGENGIITMGLIPGCVVDVKDCLFFGTEMTFVGGHSVIGNVSDDIPQCVVNLDNCDLRDSGAMGVGVYDYNRQDAFNIKNSRIGRYIKLGISANPTSKRKLGMLTQYNIDHNPLITTYEVSGASGLRIKTITGNPSSVRIDETCSAFEIFGNPNDITKVTTDWSATKQYGYEYKDDAGGSGAYACGWVNINPTTGTSLGKILGDCSITNKVLSLTINGTVYTVTFNSNYTNVSNADIIAIINNVISAVALCDEYNPENNYYPHYKGIEYNCKSVEPITKGMGVVITGNEGGLTRSLLIRKALSTDIKIDGIALDDLGTSQLGRIVTDGVHFCQSERFGLNYFAIYPSLDSVSYGTNLYIDANNAGCFTKTAGANIIAKGVGANIVSLIK